MTMPGQLEVIEQHIADAMACGGRAVVGGLGSIRKPYVGPVILADVPETSAAVTEETFGPTMTVRPVADLAEGVRLANAGRYGLGGSVYSKNRKAAMRAARSLRTGMTSINSALTVLSVPSLPFGGVGESGFGRIHGADGLKEFSRAQSITRQRMKPTAEPDQLHQDRQGPQVDHDPRHHAARQALQVAPTPRRIGADPPPTRWARAPRADHGLGGVGARAWVSAVDWSQVGGLDGG